MIFYQNLTLRKVVLMNSQNKEKDINIRTLTKSLHQASLHRVAAFLATDKFRNAARQRLGWQVSFAWDSIITLDVNHEMYYYIII